MESKRRALPSFPFDPRLREPFFFLLEKVNVQTVGRQTASFPLVIKPTLKGWVFAKRWEMKTSHFHLGLKRS